MAKKRIDLDRLNHNQMSRKALEYIMRDVIDGMEELANMSAYSEDTSACFEILAIIPPSEADALIDTTTRLQQVESTSADIIPIRKGRKQAAA